jgi:hypothetical protein
MRIFKTLAASVPLTAVILTAMSGSVFAQDTTSADLLPKELRQIFESFTGGNLIPAITGRIQLILILMLSAVILAAVIYSIIAALKYISSQGDSGKIEEAQKSIKAIFVGIGAMLVSIIGIVVIFAFFGVQLGPQKLYLSCGGGIDSAGCKACIADHESTLCKLCEASYELHKDNLDLVDPSCK